MDVEERIKLRRQIISTLLDNKILYKWKGIYKTTLKNFQKFLTDHDDVKKLYNSFVEMLPFKEAQALYSILHDDDPTDHICPVCGELCTFHQNKFTTLYRLTCGKTLCTGQLTNDDEAKEKRKKTNIERYGAEFATQTQPVQEKTRKTCTERYGVPNQMQSEEVRQKYIITVEKHFGVKCPFSSPEVMKKMRHTCEVKYGTKYPSQTKEFQEKVQNTCKERYGTKYPSQTKEFKEKRTETNLKRFGVKNVSQAEEVRQKIKTSLRFTNLFGSPFEQSELDEILAKVRHEFPNLCFNSHIKNSDIYYSNDALRRLVELMREKKNRLLRFTEIAKIFEVKLSTIQNRLKTINLLHHIFVNTPKLEDQFKTLLKSCNIQYEMHNRSLKHPETGNPFEIDFLIGNIGFEINDICTHNVKVKDKSYHLIKTLTAQQNRIRLIHLWDWELRNQELWERVSRWVLDLLNHNKIQLYARNCEVRFVKMDEEKNFLNKYHLQGYQKSLICYGLYYNNELLQLMSFCKPRYNKNYECELLRLCTKYGYIVTGGSQRLLKHFINDVKPKSLLSYCSLDKFDGKVYDKLGFKLIKSNEPQMIWYNQETNRHFNHSSLLKLGADKLLNVSYGKGVSNEDIVRLHGYESVYNCGLAVYGMTF